MKKKIKEILNPTIKIDRLDEKDIEISLLELKRRVGPPKLLFSSRSREVS